MKRTNFISLLQLHAVGFSLLACLSILGSLLLNSLQAWDLLIGLMDLSVIGSYNDFLTWFPNWGGWLFFLILFAKVFALIWILKLLIKEFKRWNTIEIIDAQTNVKRDFLIGIGWIIVLLILYSMGWFILKNSRIGAEHSLELRIVYSRGFLVQLFVQFFYYVGKHRAEIKSFANTYLFKPTSPYSLAILRILFFGYLLFIYSAKLSTVLPIVGLEHRESLPFIGWLVNSLPINPDLYKVIASIGIVSAFFVLFGWRTKLFLIVNALAIFYVMATPNFFGKLWHEQIVIWLSWIMALSNPSNVWSVDAVFKRKNEQNSPDNTWPIRIIWLHFGLIYFWAGFYKIWDAGFDWALSDSMINQVQLEWFQHYDKIPEIRIDNSPILLHFGGLAVILFELLFPFFILINNWRWIAFIGGLIMHNLLGYFLYISFLHFLQVFYMFFINFNWFIKTKESEIFSFIKPNWKVYVAGLILILNLISGMFNINSYPFSAYPKYSALIPSKIQFIKFNTEKEGIDTFVEARKSGFRWEDYGWLEYEIITKYKEGITVTSEIDNYWKIWKSKIKKLNDCNQVVVQLCERPVAPEGRFHVEVLDTFAILKK